MKKFCNVIIGVTALCAALGNAQAVQCVDPAWTRAIAEATGRPPAPGECNVRLYGRASSHEERVAAVRRTINVLVEQGVHRVPTQKLPLHPLRAEGGRHE